MIRILITVWVVGSTACGTSPDGSCPADNPTTCPTPAPSYANDVAPLIKKYCTSQCHSATGSASDQPLTYTDLSTSNDAVSEIYDCQMPMAPAAQPTLAERVTLLAWLGVCGAPNN